MPGSTEAGGCGGDGGSAAGHQPAAAGTGGAGSLEQGRELQAAAAQPSTTSSMNRAGSSLLAAREDAELRAACARPQLFSLPAEAQLTPEQCPGAAGAELNGPCKSPSVGGNQVSPGPGGKRGEKRACVFLNAWQDGRAGGAGRERRGCASLMSAFYKIFRLTSPLETHTQSMLLSMPLPPSSP